MANFDAELAQVLKEAEAEARAGAPLCTIWKNGGKAVVQGLADAIKQSHPKLYKILEGVITIIDILCP